MQEFYISYFDKENEIIKTRFTDIISENNLKKVSNMLPYLYDLYEEAVDILENGEINNRYHTFYRNKKNGKKRRIDTPDEELKKYMKKVIWIFTRRFNILFPKSVYSYVEKRTIKDLASVHREAEVVIKEDIKNFFPSCTLEFIISSMNQVFPFCMMDITILEVIVKACMVKYKGKYRLPQGAPTSPILSNISMIPFDYKVAVSIAKYGGWEGRCGIQYTRYADDIYISFKKKPYSLKRKVFTQIKHIIQQELKDLNSEFILNEEKEKMVITSRTNGVWITGIHININKEITIGNKAKQKLKAIIWSFLMDTKNGIHRSKEEIYKMQGIIGYYKYIEPDYVDMIIRKYEDKTGMDYQKEIRNILCS